MEKIKLLMVDDNVQLIEAVKEYFSKSSKIEVSYEAYDGESGIKLVEKEKDNFDVLILDLIMPNKDGMYVLDEMKRRGIDKKVIVSTSYNTVEVIRKVSDYGVNYYMLKPFDFIDLEKRILELFDKKESKNIDLRYNNIQMSITKILHELGIPDRKSVV